MNILPVHFLLLFPESEYQLNHNVLSWYEIPIVIILYVLMLSWVNRKKDSPDFKNFKLFFNLKIAGAIFITLLYNLYYVGGDTTGYYNDGRLLNMVLLRNPALAMEMFFSNGNILTWSNSLTEGFDGFRFANDPATWLVCRIAGFVELFTFRSMLGTAMVFGFFSARLMWRFYETMKSIYPFARRNMAIAVLFIPNVLLWGSGIFKDTITLSFTLFAFVCLYNIFKLRQRVFINTLFLILMIYVVFIIKSYIIVTFLGAIMIWLLGLVKIKSKTLRILLKPFVIVLFSVVFYFAFDQFTQAFEKFSIESVLETAQKTGQYLKEVSESQDGSMYDIGTLVPTVPGLLKLAPSAINVTLFRPYLWESKKIIIFFSALESTFILFFTLYVFLKVGPFKLLFQILKDPILLSFFIFTVVLAMFVGLSSFNFGTLVRYKIPCIPLYLIVLGVVLKKHQVKMLIPPSVKLK